MMSRFVFMTGISVYISFFTIFFCNRFVFNSFFSFVFTFIFATYTVHTHTHTILCLDISFTELFSTCRSVAERGEMENHDREQQ